MATAERLKGNPTAALEYIDLATPFIIDSFGAESHFDTTYVPGLTRIAGKKLI